MVFLHRPRERGRGGYREKNRGGRRADGAGLRIAHHALRPTNGGLLRALPHPDVMAPAVRLQGRRSGFRLRGIHARGPRVRVSRAGV